MGCCGVLRGWGSVVCRVRLVMLLGVLVGIRMVRMGGVLLFGL